ncbi:tetratricopeptide repeat protein [Candidatus Margulisiibacteriota bacterium]
MILVFVSANTLANISDASKVRKANKLIQKQELKKAEEIYQSLPNTKRLAFNKGYLYGQQNEQEKSEQYYQLLVQNEKASQKDKAKAYYNLGNDVFRKGEFKEAIKYYRQGLLLDSGNKRLKYNLELANNAKKMAPQQQQDKDKDQEQKDKDKQRQKQQKQKKSQEQKNAEKVLDAFKQKEQEDLKQSMQQKGGKQNVEKDW